MNNGFEIKTTSDTPLKQIAISTHDEYRKVLSTANKLETIQNKLDSVIDLFATPVISNLFSRLCNECVHLLIKCDFKLEEFRKAEELVWRRAYHDVYRLLKTKRQLIKKQDEYHIESHFMSGIGYYSSLIVQLRVRYKIVDNVQGIITPLNLALAPVEDLLDGVHDFYASPKSRTSSEAMHHPPEDEEEEEGGLIVDKISVHQWARQALYRCLVYMGDLARYLLEFSDYDHRKLAFELYRSATRYQPEQGLPYNQLATLSGNLNYNLDAVCNYMRCCLRPKPFERAEGNMIKLFDLNRKHYNELEKDAHLIKASEVLASKDPGKTAEDLMKSAIITFLKLTSDLWFAMGDNLGKELQDTVVHETQRFFEILREAMDLEPIVPLANTSSLDIDFRPISGNTSCLEKPRYVSPTIIYEFCSISIMLIARRQQKSKQETISSPILSALNDNISDLVNTLALNLLHYATSKCQRMIISKIQEVRLSRQRDTPMDKSILLKPPSETSLRNSSPISSNAASRRFTSRLRQKKAATTYTGLQSNKPIRSHRIVNDADDSDLSELEETALSTIDALDISSDMSEGPDYGTDDLINLDSSSGGGGSDDGGIKMKRRAMLSRPALRPTRSQNYEVERKSELPTESCSSLPPPDLLTGDLVDISFRTNPTIYRDASETPSEFGSELRLVQSTFELTLAYIYNQTYLPTIKVFFDWLLSNGAIIDSNIESFSSFQVELLKTVELLEELKQLIELTDGPENPSQCEIYGHTFCGPEWTQKYPLSCDHAFVNLSPMRGVHESNIDFEYERELDESESGFITIQCVMAFSYALSIFLQNKNLRLTA